MKYFLLDGKVHAFESDGSQDELIPSGAHEIPEEQAIASVSPAPTPAEAARIINAAAGQIVHDVVDGRAEEYRQAEEEARAWKSAGYTGQAPAGVATWSAASGMAAPAACDNIIAQADAWRAALMQIRGARLSAKAVAAQGNVEQALAQWAAFEAAIRQTLGIAPVVVPT